MRKLLKRLHHWFIEGNDQRQTTEYADLKDQYADQEDISHDLEIELEKLEAELMAARFMLDQKLVEIRASDRLLASLKYAIAQMER